MGSNYASAQSSRTELTLYRLEDETFESVASIRDPKEKPASVCGQARGTDHPNTSSVLSTRNLPNFRFILLHLLDTGIQDRVTKQTTGH